MSTSVKFWIDGEIVGGGEAKVAALDRGFQYGDGVFETIRAEGGSAFFLDEHLARMRRGLDALGIALPEAEERARATVRALVRAFAPHAVLTVKVIATRGTGPAGPTSRGEFRTTMLAYARADATPRPEALSAVTSTVVRNERSKLTNVKSLNFLEMLLARAEAESAGADEAIVLNTQGSIAEASAANVFAVNGGRIVTPPDEDGCLPGIVRAAVIGAAGRIGIKVSCESLSPGELAAADEAFLTNSRIGVAPLVELDGKRVGEGRTGKITLRAREAFREAELASGTALYHQDTKDTKNTDEA